MVRNCFSIFWGGSYGCVSHECTGTCSSGTTWILEGLWSTDDLITSKDCLASKFQSQNTGTHISGSKFQTIFSVSKIKSSINTLVEYWINSSCFPIFSHVGRTSWEPSDATPRLLRKLLCQALHSKVSQRLTFLQLPQEDLLRYVARCCTKLGDARKSARV